MISDPLIDAAELASALAGEDPSQRPTVLDVRWDLGTGPRPDRYAEAHIPGAIFVNLDQALADPVGDGRRGRHPLPDPSRFLAGMRAAGVDGDRPVVVYDDAGAMIAARAWWLLRHYGHSRVAVLDGGLPAWTAAGGSVESGAAGPGSTPGRFDGTPGHLPTLDVAGAAALAAAPDGVLLDARAPERYRGEVEPIDPRAGHIPGARNRPTRDNLRPDGRMLDPATLGAAFSALGVGPGRQVGAYCGSGVTAAHEVLALRIAGIDAALYPGSWSEWCADPARPSATSDA